MSARRRIQAKLDRLPDSDSITVEKVDVREALTDWHDFARAKDPIAQATAVAELSNRMFDLSTYLPGFDPELGRLRYDDEDDPDSERRADR